MLDEFFMSRYGYVLLFIALCACVWYIESLRNQRDKNREEIRKLRGW